MTDKHEKIICWVIGLLTGFSIGLVVDNIIKVVK